VPILLNWHVVRRICQITDFIKSADLCQIYKIGKNICWFYKICSFSAYFIKSSFSTQLIPAEWSCLVTCCRFIQPGKLLHPPPQKKRKAAESDEGTSLKSNEATSPASELTHPAVTRRQVAAENLKKQANRMILPGEGILPSIKVADNVLINIPSVDCGRGDPPHLIGVVVDDKDGKLRVAAKDGFLDRWLERNCLQATSYSLLKVEDVTADEEYSLRAHVRLDSVGKGQGY